MKAPKPQTRWLLYWLVAFGILGFALPEAIALTDDAKGDTLTENLQYVVDAMPFGLGPVLFLAFIVWFVPHILNRRK